MPDCSDSTRPTVATAQKALADVASELQQLDERLATVAQVIRTLNPSAVLPGELLAGVETVRSDLLRDAVSTLSALAVLTENAAIERRGEVAAAAEHIIAAVG